METQGFLTALYDARRAVDAAAALSPDYCETLERIDFDLGVLIDAAANPNREREGIDV